MVNTLKKKILKSFLFGKGGKIIFCFLCLNLLQVILWAIFTVETQICEVDYGKGRWLTCPCTSAVPPWTPWEAVFSFKNCSDVLVGCCMCISVSCFLVCEYSTMPSDFRGCTTNNFQVAAGVSGKTSWPNQKALQLEDYRAVTGYGKAKRSINVC